MASEHSDMQWAELLDEADDKIEMLAEALADLMSYHDVPGPVDAPLKPLLAAGFAALARARGESIHTRELNHEGGGE